MLDLPICNQFTIIMCISKRWIYNARGRRILVDCGTCPACRQSKALSRANRIRNNNSSLLNLFVTLTYRNDACPYILRSELVNGPVYDNLDFKGYHETGGVDYLVKNGYAQRPVTRISDDVKFFKTVNVYRDSENRWIRMKGNVHGKYRVRRHKKVHTVKLTEVAFPDGYQNDKFKHLHNYDYDKIGVCYYPDIQNFIKNLRNVLVRNFHVSDNFQFYICSEYGPTSCRPHFHLHMSIPASLFQVYKAAISKAWPYDDYYRSKRGVEIAKNDASYVATYVNSDSTVPALFQDVHSFSPSHSFSRGFGMGLYYTQLPKVLEALERGDLHVNITRLRKGVLVVDRVLLPKYVLNHYFAKFKGYYKLTTSEIESILLCPSLIDRFADRLELDDVLKHQIKVSIINKANRFVDLGYSTFDFAHYGSRVWTIYSNNVMSDFYNSFNTINDYWESYDNIEQFFQGSVESETLHDVMSLMPPNKHYETDPNLFILNLYKTSILNDAYWRYSKDKKVRNYIYSRIGVHV